jgi:hypothetical protein
LDKLVCDKAEKLILEHFMECQECQEGIGKIFTSYPIVRMVFPGLAEKYKTLLQEIKSKEGVI